MSDEIKRHLEAAGVRVKDWQTCFPCGTNYLRRPTWPETSYRAYRASRDPVAMQASLEELKGYGNDD